MRFVWLLVLVPCLGFAESRWVQVRSGPYTLMSDAGVKPAKETLGKFEQFRNALGQLLGKPDLTVDPAIRILLFKTANERDAAQAAPLLARGRDRYAIPLSADAPIPPAVLRDCTKLFLARNAGRMPPELESGIASFFSTIDSQGTRVTWGAAPPAPDLDWARIHLLATTPEYYGRLHVLLFNLDKGIAADAAYRNALGKSPTQIEAEVKAHFAAHTFAASDAPSRALSAERDFTANAVDDDAVRLAIADLLTPASAAAYQAMLREKAHIAEVNEGLALLALAKNDATAARTYLTNAIEAGSKNATALVAYARMETDAVKSRDALQKAVKADPNSAEAEFLLGEKSSDSAEREQHWKRAVTLEPRNSAYWAALARLYLERKQFADAAKAWRSAEQSAADPAEREQMHTARMAIEEQRLDYEDAERRRIIEEKERDTKRLKAAALAELRVAEARVNGGKAPSGQAPVTPWWDGPKPDAHAEGMLTQVDCIGKQLRLVMRTGGGKPLRLLIRDPAQVVFAGGETVLACGRLSAPRHAVVEYFARPNARLTTAGEVASIDFR